MEDFEQKEHVLRLEYIEVEVEKTRLGRQRAWRARIPTYRGFRAERTWAVDL
jgi:hypothetical protein